MTGRPKRPARRPHCTRLSRHRLTCCGSSPVVEQTSRSAHSVVMIGPPNVGKSVIFNRLTGMNVAVANYPGSTVEYAVGRVELGSMALRLTDAPGLYTTTPTNDAERVAVSLLAARPDLVLVVLDASNLASGIYLLLEVLAMRLPAVACINRIDLAFERGLSVRAEWLERQIGIPVVLTSAASGDGMHDLMDGLRRVLDGPEGGSHVAPGPSWDEAERLALEATTGAGASGATARDRLGDALLSPWPGLPLAIIITVMALGLVVGLGMGLRRFILLPVVRGTVIPLVAALVDSVISPGILREVMVGEYGFLTKGIEWPFTLVMPYVISFYAVLSALEDSGYMPRLGALLDGVLNRMGLSGTAVMPLLLGYGCGIPALMATRALDSRRQRLTVCVMVCLSVPCISQTGAFVSLLAERSVAALVGVAGVAVVAMVASGLVANTLLPGTRHPGLMEIPELLAPRIGVIGKKVWARVRHYLSDGVLPVMAGVAIAALMYETNAIEVVGRAMSPVVTGWLLMPAEAAVPLLLGIFRRELAVLPLVDMALEPSQLFTGAVVALFYVPCVAMVAVAAREFGLRLAVAVLLLTTLFALAAGGLFARLGALLL